MSENRKPLSGLIALKRIVEGTVDHTGEKFFKSLVKSLSEVLDASGVWVTEYLNEENKLNALAFWLNGKYVDEYLYHVAGTPCEPVLETNEICHFPNNIVQLFPTDNDIKTLKGVSYLGIALRDTDNTVLGHLAVLDSKPMEEIPEYFAVFRIFASRAAAELRRVKNEELVRESERKLDRILNGISESVIEVDGKMNITHGNIAAVKTFGYDARQFAGMHLRKLFDQEGSNKIISTCENKDHSKFFNTSWIQGTINGIDSSGNTFPNEITISAYQYHQNNYFALFIRNIKDKVKAKEELKLLNMETHMLRERINEISFNNIIGRSQKILDTINLITQVAPVDSTVLINGETGTGKELIAEAVYKNSSRNDKPFITLNCAALPSELIESELFGHVKGAFTGAVSARDGRFLMANNGTIFLDEIGELPLSLQSKLLRIIQEGTFEPVGSSKTVRTDVRIIAATHRNLLEEVKKGTFREDLFYRLNVFPIMVPPLREREQDILLIAEAVMEKLGRRARKNIKPLTKTDQQAMLQYPWPGNVRELQNIIERAIIITSDGFLNISALLHTGNPEKITLNKNLERIMTDDEINELQKQNILRALKRSAWKISGKNGAAELLKIAPTTLSSRIDKFGIKKIYPIL